MNALLSSWTLAAVSVAGVLGLLTSPNGALWAACLLALPAALWLLAGKQAPRVLLWVIFVNWLQVIGDVVAAELAGRTISEEIDGAYAAKGIICSLCAILTLALGMRWGTRLGRRLFGWSTETAGAWRGGEAGDIRLDRVVLCYFGTLAATQILSAVAATVPALAQPILALSLIKFACVYLIAATVFESGRGYAWLAMVSLLEMATGLTGFFSSYKEPFIVMLIALASTRRAMSARMWVFSVTAVAMVVWASLVWITVKREYRQYVVGLTVAERVEWMAQRLFVDSLDYVRATSVLFQRIGYTSLYAQIIARDDAGSLPDSFHYYASAVQHVLSPRILFPDKAALDDSRQTTALLGVRIAEGTSIGIGYIGQAHVDFGFPGLLLPVLVIGIGIGGAASYFMTRDSGLLVREAFTTATFFLAFPYEENIDKALGGLITSALVMAFVLKFAYPTIAGWMANSPPDRGSALGGSISDMPT